VPVRSGEPRAQRGSAEAEPGCAVGARRSDRVDLLARGIDSGIDGMEHPSNRRSQAVRLEQLRKFYRVGLFVCFILPALFRSDLRAFGHLNAEDLVFITSGRARLVIFGASGEKAANVKILYYGIVLFVRLAAVVPFFI